MTARRKRDRARIDRNGIPRKLPADFVPDVKWLFYNMPDVECLLRWQRVMASAAREEGEPPCRII